MARDLGVGPAALKCGVSAYARPSAMKALFETFVSRLLSPGELSALRHLLLEFRISRHHRCGLRKARGMSWSAPVKLNLGSGPHRKDGYLNVDIFPGGDLTLDLRRDLPSESNCCEQIFSEHCIEHFDYPDAVSHLLQECMRILKPGGLLRFSVPDTGWPLLSYAKGPDADYFHFRQRDEHRFAYDQETVRKLLKASDFKTSNVSRLIRASIPAPRDWKPFHIRTQTRLTRCL